MPKTRTKNNNNESNNKQNNESTTMNQQKNNVHNWLTAGTCYMVYLPFHTSKTLNPAIRVQISSGPSVFLILPLLINNKGVQPREIYIFCAGFILFYCNNKLEEVSYFVHFMRSNNNVHLKPEIFNLLSAQS